MATLQRPLAATLLEPAPDSPASAQAFDPTAVPRGPVGLASTVDRDALEGEREEEGDLIDLGQERLFTGSRTRRDKVEEGASDEANGARQAQGVVGSSSERIERSQELLGSLGAARHAFLFALNGLVQECLGGATSAQQSPRPDQATSSGDAPPGFDATLRRHSLAVPTPSQMAPQQPDILLTTILDTLRAHDPTTSSAASPVMLSVERASPLLGSRRQITTPNFALIQELQTRVEAAANDSLPPTEAELARTLASLLSCIERLSSITQSGDTYTRPTMSASPSRPPSMAFVDGSTPSAVYEALEQEAAALSESSREQQLPNGVVGAAREVEQAERDLLWGRVFDLSERVKLLSRQRVEALERDGEEDWMRTPQDASQDTKFRTDSLYEESLSDLPRYSHDLDSAQQNSHLPPAYYHDLVADDKKEVIAVDGGDEAADLRRSSTSAPRTRQRKVSGAHNEKTQRDFENVTSAIERLYLVSPQLANQRVEPDRRALRERQLAKLGNAIERLSQGRLENQRAVPSPAMDEDGQESTPQSRATSRRAREQRAFDRLLDQIDKAASRTLADQRVELSDKRREVLNLHTVKNDFEPLSDKYEARRREYILSHTGKGRLASQDAILRPSGVVAPFPRPAPELEESVTFGEFLEEEYGFNRPRSHSLPTNALEREKPEAVGEKGSLRVGLLKKGQGGIGLGMLDTGVIPSTAADYEVLDVPQVDWIAEESRNLGTLVVTFWPRSSHKSDPAAFEVVAVESSAILVAVKGQKTASRIALPCRVVPQQAAIQLVGSVCEVKLVTLGSTSPTKSRSDLEIHSPLSTDELRATSPTSFRCATCDAELADTSTVSRWNALPSEYWAELLDAWMCHQDQKLSDDLIAKGKGIKPRPDEVLVATSYVLLPRELTSNWTAPEQAEPAKANNGDYLHAAHCASCDALVGSHVLPADGNTSESTTVRLLKYATYPASSDPARPAPPRHTLSTYLTADMLETGQAHACHRFILEDAQTEQAKLLLWFFNPSIRLSFSSSTADANSLLSPSDANSLLSPSDSSASPSLVSRSMNSVKVFYAVVENDDAAVCATFVSAKHERIPYPLSVIQRLTSLLQASTLVYPFAKRKFGELDIGFLERL